MLTTRYAELGRDPAQWGVDAQLTVARRTLESGRAVAGDARAAKAAP